MNNIQDKIERASMTLSLDKVLGVSKKINIGVEVTTIKYKELNNIKLDDIININYYNNVNGNKKLNKVLDRGYKIIETFWVNEVPSRSFIQLEKI
jgi:hypothetical protein